MTASSAAAVFGDGEAPCSRHGVEPVEGQLAELSSARLRRLVLDLGS